MEEEQKWIREIQRRGSRQAADRLIRAYYDEIYRFAYRQTGHKEDAMDLTQTIFLAVLRALPGFDSRKASFRTWLYRIAVHKAVDGRRKARGDIVPWRTGKRRIPPTLPTRSRTGTCWTGWRGMSPAWTRIPRRCTACGSTESAPFPRLLPPWASRRRR